MLKAVKIRLYPSEEQQVYMNKLLGSCRFIYNNCLAYRIEKYQSEQKSVGFQELGRYVTLLKTKEEFSWLRESHSKVLQQTLINLESAYKSFFKNGKGFPKFKSKHDNKQSCRFPIDAIMGVTGNRINIIKALKDIHFKCSSDDEKYLNRNQNSIKSASLTKTKSGNYYFSILVDRPIIKVLPTTDAVVGIDLGIKTFVVTSENKCFDNLKLTRNNEKKLAKLHRELSRKQKDSKNKNKARIKLAKFHEKLANTKENYLHDVANQLLNENQVIVIEDLNVAGMLKNHKMARAIQELSLSRFKDILEYKARWYDRDVIEVDRWFPSSKLCGCCGYKNNNLKLSDRKWVCPKCGKMLDRDYNAAGNIKREGERLLSIKENKIGLSSPELTLVEISSVDEGWLASPRSALSLKQEQHEFH